MLEIYYITLEKYTLREVICLISDNCNFVVVSSLILKYIIFFLQRSGHLGTVCTYGDIFHFLECFYHS